MPLQLKVKETWMLLSAEKIPGRLNSIYSSFFKIVKTPSVNGGVFFIILSKYYPPSLRSARAEFALSTPNPFTLNICFLSILILWKQKYSIQNVNDTTKKNFDSVQKTIYTTQNVNDSIQKNFYTIQNANDTTPIDSDTAQNLNDSVKKNFYIIQNANDTTQINSDTAQNANKIIRNNFNRIRIVFESA